MEAHGYGLPVPNHRCKCNVCIWKWLDHGSGIIAETLGCRLQVDKERWSSLKTPTQEAFKRLSIVYMYITAHLQKHRIHRDSFIRAQNTKPV